MEHFRTKIIACLCLLVMLCACNQEETPREPSLIVEGWIDVDNYPVVLLHKSYVFDAHKTEGSSNTLEDIIEQQLIPFGKVTISDGEKELVMTGRMDTSYFPPYTYSTIGMKGEEGKTYTITAKYDNWYATATTTIPARAKFDSIRVIPINENSVQIMGYMSGVSPTLPSYYALFMRRLEDKQFLLCPLGVFSNDKFTPEGRLEIAIYNPFVKNEETFLPTTCFNKNATEQNYLLKISRLDAVSYHYWSEYSAQLLTWGIVFVPVYTNLPGNIVGGIGMWSGMGSSSYLVSF